MHGMIQHFIKHTDPGQNLDLDVAGFLNLPFNAYLKDTNGKVLAGNDFLARDAGFRQGSDMLGITDFDMAWSKEAEQIRENDLKVIAERKALSFIEKGRVHSGKLCHYASLKAPLWGKSKKVIGIFGLSFFVEEDKSEVTLFPELSKQQTKCLYYLAQGMTMKQIGQVTGLSPKTVEHYLDAVKLKLNCQSRSELIAQAIQAGILNR